MSFHIQLDSHTTIYDLFRSQLSTDVKFICSDGQVEAHSLILKANSKWFEDHSNTSAVALFSHTVDTVLEFLRLLYLGSGNIDFNSSLRQLFTLFQCSYQINKINGLSDKDRNETLIETPDKMEEHPVGIEEHPVEIKEHPVEIEERPVEIEKNLVEIGENPVEIGEHPIEIDKHPVEIRENPIEIEERPVVIDKHPVEIEKHPVEIEKNPVEIGENPVEIGEHPVEIEKHPVEISKNPVEIEERPVVIEKHPVEIENHPFKIDVPPSASDSLPSRLLPNPYALNNSTHKKKNDISRATSSSSVLLTDKDEVNEPSKNSPQEDKTNSQSSDNSDVYIVEVPPALVEIHDTLTQDLVPPPRVKVEEDDDSTPDNLEIEHSSQKRKADHTVDCIRADVITSDETDVETPPPESLAKKKKTTTRTAGGRKHQEDEDSDDSEISLPRRRRIRKTKDAQKEQKNLIRFNSTDDDEEEQNTQSKDPNRQSNDELEDSSSKNTDLKSRVMAFKSVIDMRKKMANFCFVCGDYTPLLKNHFVEHQWTRWGQRGTCPNCRQQFGKKTMLTIHLEKCKGEKK